MDPETHTVDQYGFWQYYISRNTTVLDWKGQKQDKMTIDSQTSKIIYIYIYIKIYIYRLQIYSALQDKGRMILRVAQTLVGHQEHRGQSFKP